MKQGSKKHAPHLATAVRSRTSSCGVQGCAGARALGCWGVSGSSSNTIAPIVVVDILWNGSGNFRRSSKPNSTLWPISSLMLDYDSDSSNVESSDVFKVNKIAPSKRFKAEEPVTPNVTAAPDVLSEVHI